MSIEFLAGTPTRNPREECDHTNQQNYSSGTPPLANRTGATGYHQD
jgi:hypothetical protein